MAGSPYARMGVGLDVAIQKLTQLHNNTDYDPEDYIDDISVMVEMLLALEALYQHIIGDDNP
ncbi:MAG: hypothetical protein A2Z72_06950 [Omnitrophica bacterium RBG_13_46_9]|nr:MAG: hypothetical protein A2Z72_06950 [Omnitrophica bacterium RBG_13_46_9]